jgi:hypothetical protein
MFAKVGIYCFPILALPKYMINMNHIEFLPVYKIVYCQHSDFTVNTIIKL